MRPPRSKCTMRGGGALRFAYAPYIYLCTLHPGKIGLYRLRKGPLEWTRRVLFTSAEKKKLGRSPAAQVFERLRFETRDAAVSARLRGNSWRKLLPRTEVVERLRTRPGTANVVGLKAQSLTPIAKCK